MNIEHCKYERELRVVLDAIELAASKDRTNGYSNMAFEQEVSITRLAKMAGLSASSLKQWFKETVGMTIGRYVAYRRTQYALRAMKLPANKNAKEASQFVGLNEAPALYPLLHRFGVDSALPLYYKPDEGSSGQLHSELIQLPKQFVLTRSFDGNYEDTHTIDFEEKFWNHIESIIHKYPDTLRIEGYIGIAIDNYIEGNEEAGRFTAGIRCTRLNGEKIKEIRQGELSVIEIPEGSNYRVYRCVGTFNGLTAFYHEVFADLFQDKHYNLSLSVPLFEQYENSPSDTVEEELITDVWVPVNPHHA